MTVRHVPPVAYLLAAAAFFVPFGEPADVAICVVAAALIVADGRRGDPAMRRRAPRVPVNGWAVASVASYSVAFGTFGRYSTPSRLAIVVPGALVLRAVYGDAATRPHTGRDDGGGVGAARSWPWAVLGLAFCAWELAAFFQQPSVTQTSYDHPTISALAEELQRSWAGRASIVAGWLGVGAWLVQR